MSYDLGETIELVANRFQSIASVESVIPTGSNEIQTIFAVLGKRTTDQLPTYRLISPRGQS